jgi:protein involved in polysaccharide export with SLBB domain
MREFADSNRTIVTRFLDDVDSLDNQTLSLAELDSFDLKIDDRVLISTKKDFRIRRQVSISGEVKFPGIYSIRKDKTTLIDIIGSAGGLTSDAFLRGSRIIRKDYNDAGLSEYNRLKLINYSELSPDEKSYLKYRTTDRVGAVSIDFQDFLNDDIDVDNVILRSGDSIIIKKRDLSVNVMGAVVKPGLVTYREGASYSYYIDEAGGYKSDAIKRDMRIIKGGSDIWLKSRQVDNIEVGDAIWVPEKQYVDRLKRTRDILGIIGTIAAVVVASISVAAFIDSRN